MSTQQQIKHDVHNVNSGTMLSSSGNKINLLDPDPSSITVHDIARGLSNTCRFGGQINGFYSVAQHSVLVALLAPPSLKRLAIVHDATEAYVHDIIKPLKIIIGSSYAEVEERFMKCIFKRVGLDYQELPLIKPFDKSALEIEHDYFHFKDHTLVDMFQPNYPNLPILWDASIAYAVYYKELSSIFLSIN